MIYLRSLVDVFRDAYHAWTGTTWTHASIERAAARHRAAPNERTTRV